MYYCFRAVLASRWLGLEAAAGQYFLLNTASLSALGYEHKLAEPAIRLWNDDRPTDNAGTERSHLRSVSVVAAGCDQKSALLRVLGAEVD
jgi:hypothetical protein